MDASLKHPYSAKLKSIEQIKSIVGEYPRSQKVAMCHGAFDIVHPGHVRHLMYAKEHADILIASITCDNHITKANHRPYVPEQLRALNLAAYSMVDFVLIDYEPTPIKNILELKPDYFAKGYEYASHSPKTQAETEAVKSYGGEILFTPGDVIYSSSALIEASPPNLSIEALLTTMDAHGIGFNDLRKALDALEGIKVHVVGDTIVDTITDTKLIGGLTKTPTFSVQVQHSENYTGGAGVVAKHLKAAGANVTFSTMLGDDNNGLFALNDLEACGIQVNPIFEKGRPTTNKNAIVTGGYRMLKLDTVDNRPINETTMAHLGLYLRETKSDIVVFSDFRHGLYNASTIPFLTLQIPAGTFKVADSQVASRWGNILDFKGFDLITPNEREARFALGDQDSVIRPLASRLYAEAGCKTLILKLGDRGILTQRSAIGEGQHYFYALASFAGKVVDAVGAGDALLAYSSLALKATGSDLIASILGSMAAGIECECEGNIPVSSNDVRQRIDQVERRANHR